MRVALCIPTVRAPYPQTVAAVDASMPLLREAGHVVGAVTEIGSAYISWARSQMLGKAVQWGADAVVFIDHDVSWEPHALPKLIETPGDVVCGNYRFKDETGDFMGYPLMEGGKIGIRKDGCIRADKIPAGFLKVTMRCVEQFRAAYPELICDVAEKGTQFVDLFNHGAHKGVWYGEDYAFSRRWRQEMGKDIWMIPDLTLTHHTPDRDYVGNYHEWLSARTTRDSERLAA